MKSEQLYGHLFENCPTHWKVVPFPDAVDFQEGPGILAKDFRSDGIPLIRLSGVQQSTATLDGCNFLNPDKVAKKWSHFRLRHGDLLVSTSATIGLVSEVGEETEGAIAYTGIIRMRPQTPAIIPGYIKYFMQSSSFITQAEAMAAGSVMRHFGPSHLRQMSIPLPSLPEQRVIAGVLGSLDDKIELNRRMNRTLEAMARALFKSWFVDFDPVHANAAGTPTLPPDLAALFPAEFEPSELGEIPKGWEFARLDSLLKLHYGKALPKANRKPGNIPVYGSGGITGEHNESLVRGPGIIVGRKGSVGTLYWEEQDFFPIDTTFYVEPAPSVSLHYLMNLLETLGLKDMNTDAAVPGLNRENVYRLTVAKPPRQLIEQFHHLITGLRTRIESNVRESRTLAALRDSLLPKLLSGELSVGGVSEAAA